ncbi:MAG: hypothetical protein ABIJ96_08150 [Elusimicrobiota bacterium]
MTVRPEIVSYLRLHSGKFADDALRIRLIKDGVSAQEVDDAFAIINLTRARPHTADQELLPLPRPAATTAPARSSRNKYLVFAAGAVFFGAVIGAELLLRKINAPESRQWLAAMKQQAAALTGQPAGPAGGAQQPAEMRDALANDPFISYAQLAYRSLTGKKYTDAVSYSDMALKSWADKLHGKENKKAILGIRARAHELAGESALALDDYQAVADLDPQDVEPLLGRGRIMLAKNYSKSAVNEAQKIVELDPKRPEGHALAAAAHLQLGQKRHALQSFSLALRAHGAAEAPGEKAELVANLLYNRAVLLANDRKLRLALKDLGQAIAHSPKTGPYYRARAQVYRALGENQQADADEQKAAALGPDDKPPGPSLGLGPTLPALAAGKS